MLQEFQLSLDVLNDVIDAKTPFAEALRKRFQTNVDIRPMRGQVAGLVGCELRHHIYFEYMSKDLAALSTEERRIFFLVLANAFFYRRFDDAAVQADLKEMIGEEKFNLCKPLLDLASTPENYIPPSVDRKSPLYLSLRFNVPEWAVKILSHFGGSATYQSLRKFARPANTSLRVRTSVLPLASLLESADFDSSIINGIVFYKGSTTLRKIPAFKKGQLFPEKLLTKSVFDAHPVSEPGQILLYNANEDTSLEKELIENYGDKLGLNIAVPNIDTRVDVSRLIKDKGLHNVNFFSAPDVLSMEASISSMQQLVIVSPNSTNFDLIPTSPDYLLHFDTQAMDSIIEEEQKALEGAAKYVEEGGTLLYIVYTISKKEGRMNIANFLKKHPEFSLVSERQYFPNEELETAAFVAELVKGERELTVTPPLADLASIGASAAAPTASTPSASE